MFKRSIALAPIAALAAWPRTPLHAQPIPRTVFLSNMDTEFKKMDADHNGVVTKKEVEEYEIGQILAATRAKKQQLFAALDVDHNGALSPEEFARLPLNEPAPNPQATIQRFDTNHDGAISLVEYRAGTLANFDRLDADKDGIVTPAEMKAGGIPPK